MSPSAELQDHRGREMKSQVQGKKWSFWDWVGGSGSGSAGGGG